MPYISVSNLSAGNVRYNGSTKALEVYDGSIWVEFKPDPVYISLTHDAAATLEWAAAKMQYEKKVVDLAKKYPAVRDAKEKLDIILTLIRDGTEV